METVDERIWDNETYYDALYSQLTDTFEEIAEYLDEVSSPLVRKQEELKNAEENVEEELPDEYWLNWHDEMYRYERTFPIYLYNSLLLSIYGYFENWLRKICDAFGGGHFCKVRISDLSGSNYIEKSKKYLELIVELNLEELKSNWSRLQDVQKIRNYIAHNNSNIIQNVDKPLEKQHLYHILIKEEKITLSKEFGIFYINDLSFLTEIMEVMQSYANGIVNKIRQKKVFAKNTYLAQDGESWGSEQSEYILKQILLLLNYTDTLDNNLPFEKIKMRIGKITQDMINPSLALLAFFSGGKFKAQLDRDYILSEREQGLEKLKRIYNIAKE